ncbi:efflux RND transporter periplasmic adaptor subunit [Microbulbifer bruguierae]|uniref:Efflux RND transporter periplasmic adaptor subunit n=1 Tax=Microbulbifer bruguierae TaxID=3029061 RepID=A0ABY8NEI2_9GAMM|nr:efflux RND transporter periplasmic adaptor subunit [Microbulbifer bruguierae]WGL17339.1 efflux RND transporter periplasmic adaptor subunit [Microbulbifer bruguierae]
MWSPKLLISVLLAGVVTTEVYAADQSTATMPIVVEAVVARKQPVIEEVPVTGTINTLRQAMLSAEVAGLIQSIHVDIGHRVQKGDLLLQLDPELSSISRDTALAEVIRVRETLNESRRRLNELQRLVPDKHVAETVVESLSSEVRERSAQLQAVEVESERLTALLRRHRVSAPFAGIISLREVEVGEWVEPGTALFELVDTDSLRADFQVPQQYFPRIQPRTRIQVTLDSGHSINTRVEHKIPVSRSDSRTFLLRTTIEAPEPVPKKSTPQLITGMSTSAVLQMTSGRQGIAVPRDAVLRYPDGRITVWIAAPGSEWDKITEVSEQQVTTGISFNGMIEIKSGMEAGQRVVVRGNESLQPGQKVILKPATMALGDAEGD